MLRKDININSTTANKKSKAYLKWKSMLNRCYNLKQLAKAPAYRGVDVCEDWLTFENFESWINTQPFDTELDKDLRVLGSEIYSPETCMLVSKEVNGFMIGLNDSRGKFARGVCHYPNRYRKCWKSQINLGNGSVALGWFYSEAEAHKTWQLAKAVRCLDIASRQVNQLLISRLEVIAYNLLEDSSSGVETVNLKGMKNV